MMDDHFTLQWNDYQNHLMNAFTSLRNDKDFVDLTLSCEGRKISSHKMLLSACSPYFRALLKENPCPHPVVILRQTSYEDLMAVIQFIYNGEVSLHQSRVKSFIKTAKSLKIRGLCEAEEFPADDNYSYNAEDGENGLKRGAFPPLRKKVKVEEGDEEEDYGGDSWSFDYPSNFHDEPASSMPGISEVEQGELIDVNHTLTKPARSYQRRFLMKWMKIPEFAKWLMPCHKDAGRAMCTICDKTVPAKIFDIRRHGNSKRHAEMAQNSVDKLQDYEEHTVLEEEEEEISDVGVKEGDDNSMHQMIIASSSGDLEIGNRRSLEVEPIDKKDKTFF